MRKDFFVITEGKLIREVAYPNEFEIIKLVIS